MALNRVRAFPVGSVFIAVVSTNPATLLGYGVWMAFAAGRVLVGIDAGQTEFDTVEETGGSKTHTLTTSEIPSHGHTGSVTDPGHNHTQNSHNHTQDSHLHALDTTNSGGSTSNKVSHSVRDTLSGSNPNTGSTTATNQATTATNNSNTTGISVSSNNAGGGGAHNNLQPYIVVYMWKRTE